MNPTRAALTLLAALALPGAVRAAEGTYRLDAPRELKVKKGVAQALRIAVVPRADSHVSPDAPVSVTLTASDGVGLTKLTLGREDAKATNENGIEFNVPVTATAQGSVGADLTFFICTEKLCERHKEHVQLAVRAE